MFRAADAMLITKSDLLEVLGDFDPHKATQYLRNLANPAEVITLSSRNGEHIDLWIEWLHERFDQQQQRIADGATRRPAIQPDGIALHAAN